MSEYKNIKSMGINMSENSSGVCYIPFSELDRVLGDKDRELFGHLFGCQTCTLEGMYPWDVEAVLERMNTGQLTGTQKHWD